MVKLSDAPDSRPGTVAKELLVLQISRVCGRVYRPALAWMNNWSPACSV